MAVLHDRDELVGAITISVVSHGHARHVQAMLLDLAAHCGGQVAAVLLTLNVAEPSLQRFVTDSQWPFEITLLHNSAPQSFGSNHNRAFARVGTPLFCVMNPDLRLPSNPFPALQTALDSSTAGCAYPVQLDEQGLRQDYERALPTPWSLFRRVCLRRKQSDGMDWVNGAFMLFKTDVFRNLGGFDHRYRLYCEDVDICIRLQLEGFKLRPVAVNVVHLAQRATGRRLRHLIWHTQSLFRLWASPSFWRFLQQRHQR
ncbi:MAG: glycosyltransferase [Rhodoferax sp.]|nr:glycosyltransferase [Rhodoferax sp.]